MEIDDCACPEARISNVLRPLSLREYPIFYTGHTRAEVARRIPLCWRGSRLLERPDLWTGVPHVDRVVSREAHAGDLRTFAGGSQAGSLHEQGLDTRRPGRDRRTIRLSGKGSSGTYDR